MSERNKETAICAFAPSALLAHLLLPPSLVQCLNAYANLRSFTYYEHSLWNIIFFFVFANIAKTSTGHWAQASERRASSIVIIIVAASTPLVNRKALVEQQIHRQPVGHYWRLAYDGRCPVASLPGQHGNESCGSGKLLLSASLARL